MRFEHPQSYVASCDPEPHQRVSNGTKLRMSKLGAETAPNTKNLPDSLFLYLEHDLFFDSIKRGDDPKPACNPTSFIDARAFAQMM